PRALADESKAVDTFGVDVDTEDPGPSVAELTGYARVDRAHGEVVIEHCDTARNLGQGPAVAARRSFGARDAAVTRSHRNLLAVRAGGRTFIRRRRRWVERRPEDLAARRRGRHLGHRALRRRVPRRWLGAWSPDVEFSRSPLARGVQLTSFAILRMYQR